MKNRFFRVAGLAVVLAAIMVVGSALARPAVGEQPVFLRAWGGEGDIINRAGAMVIDNNVLYISNLGMNRITRHNLSDRSFTNWGGFGVAPGQFIGRPTSIAMHSNGELYVSDLAHRIQVFNRNGQYLRGWGGQGAEPGQLNEPTDVDIYQDRVYVVERDNHRVQVFSTSGASLFMWGGVAGNADGQFRRPSGIAIDPKIGVVYIVDSQNSRVQAFDLEGNYLRQWGTYGPNDGQFRSPRKIAVDSNSLVYVADIDIELSRVQVFDQNGNFVGKFGGPGSGLGQFEEAVGIEVDESNNNNVYVGDRTRIQRFIRTGSAPVWTQDRVYGRESSERLHPAGIAVVGDLIYTTDSRPEAYALLISDEFGNLLGQWLLPEQPDGFALDGSGNVYITQPMTNSVLKYSAFNSGQPNTPVLLREWTGFNRPLDVAIDNQGRLLVADTQNNQIQRFAADGNPESVIGVGQVTAPSGLAVDSQGYIYAFDQGLMRVVKFDAAGGVVDTWGSEGTGEGQFGRVVNLARAFDAPRITIHGDDVIVTDPGNSRIQHFTRDGNFLAQGGEPGPRAGQFARPTDVAVAANGDIFISDSENNNVQVHRIAERPVDAATGPFINGRMEQGSALTGWAYSRSIGRSLPTSRQPGAAPGSDGSYVMRLGDPVASTEQGQGSAWASQVVYVDETLDNPTLSFDYAIHTNTTIDWSDFYVEIRDGVGVDTLGVVLRDGYRGVETPGLNMGWRYHFYDLSAYKGQTIRIIFQNRNLHQASLGIWTELDNVRIGERDKFELFIPVVKG